MFIYSVVDYINSRAAFNRAGQYVNIITSSSYETICHFRSGILLYKDRLFPGFKDCITVNDLFFIISTEVGGIWSKIFRYLILSPSPSVDVLLRRFRNIKLYPVFKDIA